MIDFLLNYATRNATTDDTCEARVSDLEVASKVLRTWIMNEQIADIKLAGALTGTDAVDLRQHVP